MYHHVAELSKRAIMFPPRMTRAGLTAIAVLIGPTSAAVADSHNQQRATNASAHGTDIPTCVVPSAAGVPGQDGIAIDHIRFEDAPPLGGSPSVVLRFDIRNDTAADLAGVIVWMALFEHADRMPAAPRLLERPLEVLVNVPLPPKFSFGYKVRLKNLSLEFACESDVVVVAVPATRSSVGRLVGLKEIVSEAPQRDTAANSCAGDTRCT